MDKMNENNKVTIMGEVVSEFTFSHEIYGEGFYLVDILVPRLSDSADQIPLMVSERLLDVKQDYRGEKIKVTGNIKLYSVLYIRSKETDYSGLQLDSLSKDLLKTYKQVVFVGDSRTVRTEKTLKLSGYSPSAYNISFIASTGMGLSWLKETGYKQLLSKVGNSTSKLGKPTAIIFNFGINDMSNISGYVSYMKSIAPELEKRGCKLYYMSLNPVNNVMAKLGGKKSRPEATVRAFNAKIKSQLCGKANSYTYINTYDYLMKYGFGTDAGKEGYDVGADDGLHYTSKTTKRIFRYCINTIL